ncbi:MAG: hypothetical protein ABJT31_00095 [Hyphomicrobiales bacterium]
MSFLMKMLGISAMVLSWSDLSAPLVYTCSIATVGKSGLTTAAVMVAFLIRGRAAAQRAQRIA